MATSTSLRAIDAKRFTFVEAQHLLNRAAFGGTPSQIFAIQQMGPEKAVEFIVNYKAISDDALPSPDYDESIIRPLTREERMLQRQARRNGNRDVLDRFQAVRQLRLREDRAQMAEIRKWWMSRIIATPRPLEEQLTLLWHGHFASNHRTVRDSYLMLKQNAFFRDHAAGSFEELAHGIIRDPAMLAFLNNDRNRKESPNENLARELMELFTVGEGNYSENDIKEGARALTGYSYNDNEFRFNKPQHDDGRKTILGQTDNWDGDGFVDLLLKHPACPQFIAYKLYRHFVSDLSAGVTSEARSVIQQLSRELIRERYKIAPVVQTLLMSEHFYDRQVMGNKIKSPVQLVASTVRVLDAPVRDIGLLTDACGHMGQELFDPPSVAGWDGGRSWINTSTLFVRQNLCAYVLSGKLPYDDGWTSDRVGFDPASMIADLTTTSPEAIVEHLGTTLLGSQLNPGRRQRLVAYLQDRTDPTTSDALLGLLLLITALPEYQLH